jgi:hypothetical protein
VPDETPVAPAPAADPLPAQLERADLLELSLFQEKVNGIALKMQLVQKDLAAIEGDRQEFVVTQLKPKYKMGEGDQIDASTGKILRKGDPNLTIVKQPAAAAVTPAIMG